MQKALPFVLLFATGLLAGCGEKTPAPTGDGKAAEVNTAKVREGMGNGPDTMKAIE